MDLLIDLIIALIKAATKESKPPRLPPVPFDEEQRRALSAQMQALQQQAIATQRHGPARPIAVPSAAARKPQRRTPKPPALPARAVATTAAPVPAPPRTAQPTRAAAARAPLRVPLIMGEILGPPLALREPEF